MANDTLASIAVGTDKRIKPIEPVLLTAIGPSGQAVAVKVATDGTLATGYSSSSKKNSVDAADDLLVTYSYLDAGTVDQRILAVIHSSTALSLSYTDTFTYAGLTGNYRISAVTRT